MKGLCGWLTLDRTGPAGMAELESMIQGLFTPAGHTGLAEDQAACAAPVQGMHRQDDGLLSVIVGQPHWSATELAERQQAQGAAAALCTAYRRHGTDLFRHLRGAFALAILDRRSRRLLAAVDRMGRHPLYYAEIPGGLVFGSTADSVRAHPGVDGGVSLQGLFNYVYFHMVPSPGTVYQAQRKLPAAHYLDYRDGRATVAGYWQPAFEEPDGVSTAALADELQTLILDAVNRSSDTDSVGAFLSGGLDSSTVAGMLARLRAGAARTYSIGFAVDGYDEMAYARIAARHFDTRQHEYYVTPEDVADAVPLIARSYDEPFGNSSAVPAYYCARLAAADGVTRLLAGDGGDELFAGNERYARQFLFEHYRRLPRTVRAGLLEPALRRLPGGLPLVRKSLSYVNQANVPLPDRLESYNFLHRHAPGEMFDADFLAAVDLEQPLRVLRELYHRPSQGSPLNRMMYLDWQRTLADNDLRKVNRMCALAGVDVVYPLLDDALVEFSCRVPSALKLKGRQLRHFYKRAMDGFLPEAIIKKSKHGFGLPFGIWMREHRPLQELAYDSLLALKNRAYLRPAFIDRAMELHRSGHASYYGELVWVLMMLELWLEQHDRQGNP